MTAEVSTVSIIAKARSLLRVARLGCTDISASHPARRAPGLYNVAVFGRR